MESGITVPQQALMRASRDSLKDAVCALVLQPESEDGSTGIDHGGQACGQRVPRRPRTRSMMRAIAVTERRPVRYRHPLRAPDHAMSVAGTGLSQRARASYQDPTSS
jgi:hypothetical protein